jgi:hypothetical protein
VFYSLDDCFVWNFEAIGVVYGFLSGFPPFDAFLILVSMGKRCIFKKRNVFRERTILLPQVNREKMYTKPSPHPLSAVSVEIACPRIPLGVKGSGRGYFK